MKAKHVGDVLRKNASLAHQTDLCRQSEQAGAKFRLRGLAPRQLPHRSPRSAVDKAGQFGHLLGSQKPLEEKGE
jgi:hypothetical protein